MTDRKSTRPGPATPLTISSKGARMPTINPITAALRATPAAAWRETAEAEPAEEVATPNRKRIRTSRKPYARSLSRRKGAALVKIVGERMKAARELCNMSQAEAAAHLGYANPSKLNKIEKASDTDSVPFWVIREAAQLYDVSTEYLFGLSDDFETGCYRGITSFLQQQWDKQRARDLKTLAILNSRITASLKALPALQAAAEYAVASVELVEARNLDFDEMPGGARLQASARGLKEAIAEVTKAQRYLHLQLPPELQKEADHA